MESRVRRWGNSFGILIPRTMAKDLGLVPDCAITLEVQSGKLIVRPMPKKYSLHDFFVSDSGKRPSRN
jgi:antitoxin MazE